MTGKASRPPSAQPAPARAAVLPRGQRVLLRPLAGSDAQEFIAAVRSSRRLHRPWVIPPATTAEFARRMQGRSGDSKSVALLAVRRHDDALLGLFNLSEIIRGPLQQSFLGYYAFAPHAGQGYMKEALQLVLAHAFRALQLHRIEANIQPGNLPSIALVRGCGFVREGFSERYLKIGGRWRDHERWAITREAWSSR